MVEIERKFLVTSHGYRKEAISKERIVQGFLNTHKERTVRVRISGDFGYLTIKGKSNVSGTSRFEWETEISVEDAENLLDLCEEGIIEKTRFKIPVGKHIFEVDEFYGENQGLIIAEVELNDENETIEKPEWLGEEVTGNVNYYNSQLSKQPYKTWKK
ncbi:CYTH domain-containing protein [Maribacter halichondriae]|uniref:CYTH domain-containing protein n=1 Tax=Maribacter halichondriae TaxID=2980554 RepID=UPI00235A2D03|nr:CYTH domain-containing protein [Maribacter sp. Hal144]